MSGLVVRANQVSHHLSKFRLLDASWFMPNSPRNAFKEFQAKRLPGSRFLDLDEVASPHPLGLKHMMPTPKHFASACSQLGISRNQHVVLYDTHGVFSSPRALFMFRAFGHEESSVLDGGLPAWEAQGLPTEEGAFVPSSTTSHLETYPIPNYDQSVIADYQAITSHISKDPQSLDEIVLDARSNGRFTGKDPEPRPGLKSGHMPNSVSLPFNLFLKTENGSNGMSYTTLLSPGEIKAALVEAVGAEQAEKIVKGELGVITSCGSGMTAGILWLGLRILGAPKIRLYDESWTGYALRYPESRIIPQAI